MNGTATAQVLSLLLLLAVGGLARKGGILGGATARDLSMIVTRVTLPAMVVTSFLRPFSAGMLSNAGRALLCVLCVSAVLILASHLVFRSAARRERPVLQFMTVFPNFGYMGLPVLASLHSETGVFYGAAMGVAFNLLMFSWGVEIFADEVSPRGLLRALANPVLGATAVGLVLFVTGLPVPSAVASGLRALGGATTPLSMMLIGAGLADVWSSRMLEGRAIYVGATLRLLAVPLLTCAVLRWLEVDATISRMVVTIEAMPVAATVGVFAERYGGDLAFASRGAFLTTCASLVTIPLVLWLA